MRGRPKTTRNARIAVLRRRGWLLRELAAEFNIHTSRVASILSRLGVAVDLRFKEAG